MLLQACEPLSGAIVLCLLDHMSCHARRSSRVPRARVWLRRTSDVVLDALGQELAEPMLDCLNHASAPLDPRVAVLAACILFAAQFLIVLALARRQHTLS